MENFSVNDVVVAYENAYPELSLAIYKGKSNSDIFREKYSFMLQTDPLLLDKLIFQPNEKGDAVLAHLIKIGHMQASVTIDEDYKIDYLVEFTELGRKHVGEVRG